MKKCPECGSVSGDDDLNCGVCGTSLEGVPYESLDILSEKPEPLIKPKGKLHPLAITLVGVIIFLIAVGAYEIFLFHNGFGFIVIVLGLALIVALLGGFDTSPLRRPGYRGY